MPQAQTPEFLSDLSSVSLYAPPPMQVTKSVQNIPKISFPLSQLTKEEIFQFGHFKLNENQRLLLYEAEPVEIKSKDFDVLLVLLKNQPDLVTKKVLLATVWPDSFVEEANLGVHVAQLRKVLRRHSVDQEYIQTVHKHGYRFISQVSLAKPRSRYSSKLYPIGLKAKPQQKSETVAEAVLTLSGGLRIEAWRCSEGTKIKLAVPAGLRSIRPYGEQSFEMDGLQFSTVDHGGMLHITVSLDSGLP
jgi:DNA-binding winged helix-turn-helix (wHTH) protein